MKTTYERNDGIHGSTGIAMATLCPHAWAKAWLEEVKGALPEDYAREVAQISKAEERFFACTPEAREEALALTANESVKWGDFPEAAERLAAIAEALTK